jgi:hypothetical protein
LLNIVGGMGHQIAGSDPIEVGSRKVLDMGEQPVSETLFDSSGGTQKAATPDVAKDTDENCDPDHKKRIRQQLPGFDSKCRQIVDNPFNNAGDKELQHVDDYQAEQPNQYPEAIFDKIGFDQRGCFFHKFFGLLVTGCWLLITC